ncbi:hypothetical protein D3C79_711380 [compost metagenome]
MQQVVPRPRQHRLEPANQLVLPLRPGIETLQPFGDGKVHALVETGFEMQPVEFVQAPPVAAKQAVAPHQAQGHGHITATLPRHHHAQGLGHALGQQAEELACQVGRTAAHRVGIGVAAVDEIPLRLIQFTPTVPAEFNTVPGHLFTLLAHLLALARTQAVEKILEVTVAVVAPMKLAAQALHPARQAGQLFVQRRLGEIDVRTRQPALAQVLRQRLQHQQAIGWVGGEQARAADRAERHGTEQLGVVGNAGPLTGIGPAMVEHVLAKRVPFAVRRQQRPYLPVTFQHQVLGGPAGVARDAAAVLHGAEKRMAQERLAGRHQGIPGGRR